MSRRRKAIKKDFAPDPKFKSPLVTQFINNVVRRGKKRLCERLFYDAIDIIAERSGTPDAIGVLRRRLITSNRFLR
jgi:small subunit ribosomal protein S7